MMAALFPIDREDVEDILRRTADIGCIRVANYNSPSQFVVAGQSAAVQAAMDIAQDEFSIDPVIIEKKIPMHTPVFSSVAEALLPHLKQARFRSPVRPYISNVLGTYVNDATPERIIELLAQHVYSPVLWRQAIDEVVSRRPDAVFVEVGPRGVLYNMLQKRWHANVKFKTDVSEDIAANIGTIKGTRTHVQEARA
jgi:[acyl-carrier-protein] S-malonyltransferase